MGSGTDRIRRILHNDLELTDVDPSSQGTRVLLLGFIGCQIVGFTIALVSDLGDSFAETGSLALVFGLILSVVCLLGGYHFSKVSEQTAVSRLLLDCYEAARIFFYGNKDHTGGPAAAVTAVVTILLDNGITSESVLISQLQNQGFSESSCQNAVALLQERGFISVRANGVSLIQAKRRLFM